MRPLGVLRVATEVQVPEPSVFLQKCLVNSSIRTACCNRRASLVRQIKYRQRKTVGVVPKGPTERDRWRDTNRPYRHAVEARRLGAEPHARRGIASVVFRGSASSDE